MKRPSACFINVVTLQDWIDVLDLNILVCITDTGVAGSLVWR